MRSAQEIAKDLIVAEQALDGLAMMNAAGKTFDELAEMRVRRMEIERQIHRLRKEQADWVSAH